MYKLLDICIVFIVVVVLVFIYLFSQDFNNVKRKNSEITSNELIKKYELPDAVENIEVITSGKTTYVYFYQQGRHYILMINPDGSKSLAFR